MRRGKKKGVVRRGTVWAEKKKRTHRVKGKRRENHVVMQSQREEKLIKGKKSRLEGGEDDRSGGEERGGNEMVRGVERKAKQWGEQSYIT